MTATSLAGLTRIFISVSSGLGMESIASGFGGVGCSSQRCIAVLIVGFGVAGLGDNKERSKLSEDFT